MSNGDKEVLKLIKNTKAKKGFTMIEVIVSAAILAILAISLIPLISFGYSETVSSGQKSTAVYKDAESLESNFNSETDGITNITSKTIVISFGEADISIPGKLLKATKSYDSLRNPVVISAFKPD